MNTTVKYVCVADTETGGLPSKGGKGKPEKKAFYDVALVEVALVVVDCINLKIVDEYNEIISPYKEDCEYSPGAESVHGLSKKYLEENGLDVKEVYKGVKSFMKTYANPKIGTILAGHNFQLFDVPFFEGLFNFHGDNLWDYVKFIEDTMKLGWYRAIEQENYKLGTCCTKEGVELVDAHRALTDTRANAKLFMKYIELLRGNGGGQVQKSTSLKPSRFRETFQLV